MMGINMIGMEEMGMKEDGANKGDDDDDRRGIRRNDRHGSDEPELYQVFKARVHDGIDRKTRYDRYGGSNEPELYQVYKGRVGRKDTVYVSHIATRRRIHNARDVVNCHQEVYLKVIYVSGLDLCLSMRDVDQNIGEDLLLQGKRPRDENAFRSVPFWD